MIVGGRYRLLRVIGEGGMGAVYEGEHVHMRKRSAVKVLHPEMSRVPEMASRFEREAMAAAHIDHPNVAAATSTILSARGTRNRRDPRGSHARHPALSHDCFHWNRSNMDVPVARITLMATL
jgi:serine/threonine protein kinase